VANFTALGTYKSLYKGPLASYTTLRAAASADVLLTTFALCGQRNFGTTYNITRMPLVFDTSVIPVGSNITGAAIHLYANSLSADTAWSVVVQTGGGTRPYYPIALEDYNYSLYSGDGGSLASADIVLSAWNTLTLNSTGRSWIVPEGYTRFMLRNNREIAGTAPSGEEELGCYHYSGQATYLTVTWGTIYSGTLSASVSATITADPLRVFNGQAALAAVASLFANPPQIKFGEMSAQAIASLIAAGGMPILATSAMSVSSILQAAGWRVAQVVGAESAIIAAGNVGAVGDKFITATVSITSASSLSASALLYIIQALSYAGTLAPGDFLEIDCDKRTVKLNGSDVRYNHSGDFPSVYPGVNTLTWDDAEAARTAALTIRHKEREL
jgi:hypothetical protein